MTRRGSVLRLRVAALGAALLLINAVAFAAFSWPRLTHVRRAEERSRSVAARKAELETLWARIDERKKVLAQDRADIEVLTKDLLKPRSQDLFTAQRDIESLARSSGLKPKKSTYSLEIVKGTSFVRCVVTMPLDGSYNDLTSFLSRVEMARRFIAVDQMALAQDDAGARMNLRLSALFREDEPLAASR